MYEFEYELQKEDYVDFNLCHAEKSITVRKTIRFLRIISPIMILICGYFITGGLKDLFGLSLFAIFASLFAIFVPKIYFRAMRRNIEKMINEGNDTSIFETRKVSIQEQEITHEIVQKGIFKKWSKIIKIEESNNNIFLYVSDLEAIIIPKKVVGEDDEILRLKNYCKRS